MTEKVKVAIVDDDAMVRMGLEAWLAREAADLEIVLVTHDWAQLLEHEAFPPDVVLLDFQLHDGVPAPFKVATLRAAEVGCVLISSHATPAEVRACVDAGALAYLPKSEPAPEIVAAVLHAARGESYLTPMLAGLLVADRAAAPEVPRLSPQELRALTLYASGLPMKSVARRLNVGYDTAKGYIDRVREKYEAGGRDARTKVELYQRAVEDGFV